MTGDSPTSGGHQPPLEPAIDDGVLPSLTSREQVAARASADFKAGDTDRVCAFVRSVASLTIDAPQLADVDPEADGLPPATDELIAETPTKRHNSPHTVRVDGHLLLFHAGVLRRLTEAQVEALVEGLGEAAVAAVMEEDR